MFLKKVSIMELMLKTIPIPFDLIKASLIAAIVQYATDGLTSDVINLSVYLCILMLIMLAISIISTIVIEKKKTKAIHNCKMQIYRSFLKQQFYYLNKTSQGDTIEKFNDDFETISNLYTNMYPNLFVGIATIVSYSVFIGLQDIKIATFLLVISLIQIIPQIVIKKFKKENYEDTRNIESEITECTIEAYRGFKTIKLYNLRNWYLKRLKVLQSSLQQIGSKAEIIGMFEDTTNNIITYVLKYGTYALVGFFILQGKIETSMGVEVISLSAGLFSAVLSVLSLVSKFAVFSVAEKRFEQYFNRTNNEDVEIDLNASVLTANKATFCYDNKSILNELSLNLQLDKITLIKGSNGCGKTTFIKLILGFFKCCSGEITIDGTETYKIPEENLNNMFFYMPQEDVDLSITPIELFETMFTEKMSKQLFLKNALDYGLTTDILGNSVITDLSGGEKKKVYLSIAFASGRKTLLLDEPTNHLDSQGKVKFVEMLKMYKPGAIIISHDNYLDAIADFKYEFKEENHAITES